MSVFLATLWFTTSPAALAGERTDCGDLQALTRRSTRGTLSSRERSCLEQTGTTTQDPELRTQAGLILAINALARADDQEWARLSQVFEESIQLAEQELHRQVYGDQLHTEAVRDQLSTRLHRAMVLRDDTDRVPVVVTLYGALAQHHAAKDAFLNEWQLALTPGERQYALVEYEAAVRRWVHYGAQHGQDLLEPCIALTHQRSWCVD